MKVLIVDDNQDITGLLSKFLKAKGFDNVVTNDPRDGLERIKGEKYDVVLLDISMPEFSGIDIIQTLEREKILKDQKIVIFSATAFTTSQINDLLKKEGIQGCLKKPIQLNELLTAITSWGLLLKFLWSQLNLFSIHPKDAKSITQNRNQNALSKMLLKKNKENQNSKDQKITQEKHEIICQMKNKGTMKWI